MRKYSGVVLAVVGLVLSCYAEGWGADWRFVIKSVLSETFIDVKSMSKLPNNTGRVWKKGILTDKGREVFAEERKQLKCKDLSYVLALIEYDCTEKKWRLLSATWYSNDGTPLDCEDDKENSWKFIAPDSTGDYTMKEVCE